MPIQIPKHLFEEAHELASIDKEIVWDATNFIRGVYSRYCPAIVGNRDDFSKFFGLLVLEMHRDCEGFSESNVLDLADRTVEDSMGLDRIFGFSGVELT